MAEIRGFPTKTPFFSLMPFSEGVLARPPFFGLFAIPLACHPFGPSGQNRHKNR
jgi:hypothetical protein